VTLNGSVAVITLYFTQYGSFRGYLRLIHWSYRPMPSAQKCGPDSLWAMYGLCLMADKARSPQYSWASCCSYYDYLYIILQLYIHDHRWGKMAATLWFLHYHYL